MPIEFIPNQPVIFENPIGDYPCLNNDPKVYGPLMQLGDEMCMQWKLTPCGTPLCEPDMYMDPAGSDELGAWTVVGGWATTGSDNLTFDGTGNPASYAEQTLTGLVVGTVYKLTFDVTNYSGVVDYEVSFDFGQAGITFSGVGTYEVYFIALNSSYLVSFNHNGTASAADQLTIENLQAVQWTQCWQDGLDLSSYNWTYDYDALTQQGRFCSYGNSGTLINTNAFINTANYHGISMVISNCTQGGVEVYIDGAITPIGTTSGNGEFTYYGNPSTNDLIFNKVGNFDGCISQVVVNDYGVIGDYYINFFNANSTTTSSNATLTVYDDRLVWCGTMESLTWTIDGVPDADLQCDQLYTYLYDPCDGVYHLSVNAINYNKLGHDCTKFVEAWNDGYAFGFYFGDVNAPDFKLKQRLRVLAFNPVYRNSGEEYLYSSGQTVRSYAQSQKARTAWFDYCDEYCHDTIRTQLLSQKLTIEGVSFYFPTEDYEPEWNDRGRYNLAQSRVTLFHELSTFGSTCGIIANPFCPPTQQACIVEEVSAKLLSFNISTYDYINNTVFFSSVEFDENGNYISTYIGTGADISTAGGRLTMTTNIINRINALYGTSASGNITLSGNLLTINISASVNSIMPMKFAFMYIQDSLGQLIPIPIYFS